VPIDSDPRALAILHEWVKTTGAEMNEARLRMTRIPKGAELILNKVSGAPGFWIGNRPNAQSRTCWSECGEHNQIATEPPPLTATFTSELEIFLTASRIDRQLSRTTAVHGVDLIQFL
jgi:hypothetical protein